MAVAYRLEAIWGLKARPRLEHALPEAKPAVKESENSAFWQRAPTRTPAKPGSAWWAENLTQTMRLLCGRSL